MASKAIAGAATGNPYVAGAGLVLDAAGALVGGSNQPKEQTSWYVAPEQAALLRQLILQQYQGGDAGLGADLKAGYATMGQSLAGRGIAPTSGVYTGAMGDMTAQAVAAAAQRRFENLRSLISMSPAMVTGKIGNPDVAGYSWTPEGLQERQPGTSNWGTPDATWDGTKNINAQSPNWLSSLGSFGGSGAVPKQSSTLGSGFALGRTPTQRARVGFGTGTVNRGW
ncbi:MAG: hypothetical protein WC120_05405 [Parcubacteria group bacterium]|jgi:hypothetical protein